MAEVALRGHDRKIQPDRPPRGGRHGQGKAALRRKGADQQRRRTAVWRQRDLAEGGTALQGGDRQIDGAQQFPRLQRIFARAADEIDHRQRPGARLRHPNPADPVERRGQRRHRTRRQRQTKIAAHRRAIPNLERSQQRATALAEQRAGMPGGRELGGCQRRERAGGADPQAVSVCFQCGPAKLHKVDQPCQCRLRLGKQPSPTRKPRIAGTPGRQIIPAPGAADLGDGIQVHQAAPLRNRSDGTQYKCHHTG